MKEQIFRKKSIDRISSPEQLNEYIRVSSPSVWMILGAIVILLFGVCVWGVFGKLDTVINTVAVFEEEQLVVYVKEEDRSSVELGMKMIIEEKEFVLREISKEPIQVDSGFSEYIMHVGSMQMGEWVYEVLADGRLAEGVYEARIIIESVAPMSFIMN